jgi:hypothetical protein
MTRTRVSRAWCAPLALACAIGCSSHSLVEGQARQGAAACAAPPVLTWSYKLSSKLFINTIGVGNCLRSTANVLPLGTPAQQAAYFTFCKMSSFGENPPSDAIVNPLDARILETAQGSWSCQAGNAAPFAGVWAGGGRWGGPEPLGFTGVANPVATRDNINLNGTFGFVASGHPNPALEWSFKVHRWRASPDIWNKTTATITCGVDNRGQPTTSLNLRLARTAFPSHKIWRRSPANAPAAVLLFNVPQGLFSNLWFLPAIPAP